MHLPKSARDLYRRLTTSALVVGALFLFIRAGLVQEAFSPPAPAPANNSGNGAPSNTPSPKSNTKQSKSDTTSSTSSTNTQQTIVVRGEELPSAYGAP
jgi:hypothetical protein